ncbi:hypothetical protein EU78_00640 [Mycolicibacterium rufum]|nr:hypothetical protein EU78_00640 [Mycolicibacterium rufum]
MLMTWAPMLAACTIARARLRSDPAVCVAFGSLGSVRVPTGWKLSEVWRSERIRASGATPMNASVGAGRPAMTAAVRVPWASQSDIPFPAWSTKSPPGSAGTRGDPFTPVSMTATVTPAPVANRCASASRR